MIPSTTLTELINQSIQQERLGNMAAAIERARSAQDQARAQDDSEGIAAALVRAGEIHYRMGHYDDVRACAEQALVHAGNESHARADALILLGWRSMEVGLLAEAESFFLGAANLCRQIGYEHSRFRALHNLGSGVYSPRGQFDLALAALEEAYRIASELNSPMRAATLIAITFVYLNSAQQQRARAALDRLAQVASAASLYQGSFYCLSSLLALDEGDLPAASSFCAQARSIAEQIGDPTLNIFIRLAQSRYHRIGGNASAALDWANDAITYASRAGISRMLGWALIEHARTAWLNGDVDQAEIDLRDAIQELSARGRLGDLARAQFLLAALLHTQTRPETESAWLDAAKLIVSAGYAFILDQDRARAYPLIAAYLNSANAELAQISAQCIERLQSVPPPPLRIVTLGAFEVCQGARPVDRRALHKRRAGELLALLLLAPSHSLSFDQITDALWRDKGHTAAQSLFHQATSALRRALEPELPDKFPSRYILVEEGQVTFHLPPGSTIDFRSFEHHCNSEDWDAALAAYRGDLLPDCLYADWAATPRERLRHLYLRTLLVLAHRRDRDGQHREALDLCHRILEIEPWQEDAVLIGMRACLAFSDRAGALRLYRELESALHEDLSTTPQAALRELYESVIGMQMTGGQ